MFVSRRAQQTSHIPSVISYPLHTEEDIQRAIKDDERIRTVVHSIKGTPSLHNHVPLVSGNDYMQCILESVVSSFLTARTDSIGLLVASLIISYICITLFNFV